MDYRSDEIEKANKRAKTRLEKTPIVRSVTNDPVNNFLHIDLNNGLRLSFPPQMAQGLEQATPEQLDEVEISPSGLGLHFPAIDADIYIPGLLEGFLGSERWMASQLGRAGGNVKSKAKAVAARKNGKLGGRPKKALANG